MKQRQRFCLVAGAATVVGAAILPVAVAWFAWQGGTVLPETVARDYIRETEGWPDTSYIVEHTCRTDDEGNVVIVVIHEDDLMARHPGGGKSLELHIDLQKRQVVKVLGFQ